MRVVFMGTAAFAIPALERLFDSTHELVAVVTQPDRPAGRGHRLQAPPVKQRAAELGLDVLQPPRASAPSFVDTLRAMKPDLICVVAYGQLLRPSLLEVPPHGCLNVHPSLLPRYRGAAPIQRAIINGESVTGVTVMFLDEGEDTGDIILQQEMAIDPEDTTLTLSEKLAHLGADLLVDVVTRAEKGPLPRIPQDARRATHAPKLTKEEGHVLWNEPARQIHNRIRGMLPWPGAFTHFEGNKALKLLRSRVGTFPGPPEVPPGSVEVTRARDLWVQTGDGGLQLLEVQPANKRAMSATDFINGYRIASGMRFK